MAILQDPLESYSGLAVFPQTLGHLNPPPTSDPLSIHSFLKPLPVGDPDKLGHQGRSILETASEVPKIPEVTLQEEAETNENVASPRGRRKGLDRKRERPRFSLAPNITNSSANAEPAVVFELKDPQKFFLAYERVENAKREIAKQTGHVSGDSSQNDGSTMAPRQRRQGIPGRSRTAKYQHLYSTVSSQEPIGEESLSPANHGLKKEIVYPDAVLQEKEVVAKLQRGAENVASEEMEQAGSILKTEVRVDKLLHELLLNEVEDLDGDRALNLLQDHLQIKSLEVEKLNLPELEYVRRANLNAPGVNVPKPRYVFSDIQNLLKSTRTRSPMKQRKMGNSACGLGSPITPRSTLASVSFLKERLLQSNLPTDPYSVDDMDQLPARNTSAFENPNKSSDPADIEEELKSIMIEDETTSPKDNAADMATRGMDENSMEFDADTDVQKNETTGMEDMVGNMEQEAAGFSQSDPGVLKIIQNQFDHPMVEEQPMDECSEIQDDSKKTKNTSLKEMQDAASELHHEKIYEPSVVSTNEQIKAKLCPRKKKELSRRKSLAAAGSIWNSAGVRRSTRITSKPLEYWKGEKFLYGRIHESLPTVIGVKKCKTPKMARKDYRKRNIIVESFVSDEYKDRVELAA